MRIIDLEAKYEQTYLICLEDWSDEMKEAGDHRKNWHALMKDRGLRAKLAESDEGKIIGMVQYMPAEFSFVEKGEGYYMIMCIWVHGHKDGVGNQQKSGIGTQLLDAVVSDCEAMGVKGVLAWGVSLPFWMKASWFKKHDFQQIDKDGMTVLLVKGVQGEAEMPQLIRMKKKPPKGQDRVKIMAFKNGWCSASNIVLERTLRAAKDFGDKVDLEVVNTMDREAFLEWGIFDGVYIDGKTAQKGPPPSYEKIYRIIEKAAKHYKP
jgi:N-acetylglutamate synthase-like GNAT family acetyltransferase